MAHGPESVNPWCRISSHWEPEKQNLFPPFPQKRFYFNLVKSQMTISHTIQKQ